MTTFRCDEGHKATPKRKLLAGGAAAFMFFAPSVQAQERSISLEPISAEGIDIVSVKNFYGKCGSAVVQVLGVSQQIDDFYSVDGNADIVVIQAGGRREIHLRKFLSDHNGVACLGSASVKKLLIWSDCTGSACGHGWSFTVVDLRTFAIAAGLIGKCDEKCAARATGSNMPLRLSRP